MLLDSGCYAGSERERSVVLLSWRGSSRGLEVMRLMFQAVILPSNRKRKRDSLKELDRQKKKGCDKERDRK